MPSTISFGVVLSLASISTVVFGQQLAIVNQTNAADAAAQAEVLPPVNVAPEPLNAGPAQTPQVRVPLWVPPKWGSPQAIPGTIPQQFGAANGLQLQAPQQSSSQPLAQLSPRLFVSPAAGGRVQVDLFPGAGDPSDIQTNPLFNSSPLQPDAGLGEGVDLALPFLLASRDAPVTDDEAAKFPVFRLGLQVRPGIFYDTGFITTTAFVPGNIALDGTADAHKRGQLNFVKIPGTLTDISSLLPARAQVDSQAQGLFGTGPAQAYLDSVFVEGNQFVARTAVVRILDPDEINGFLIGKAETAFGDIGSVPIIVANGGAPIGAVAVAKDPAVPTDIGVAQLRYSRYSFDNRVEFTTSIEDQTDLNDVANATTDPVLHRWPVFVQRLRLRGATNFDSYQIAGLVRPIVFDDSQFRDHTVTGWGISALARFSDACERNAFYIGAAGGKGIGSYIYGGTKAAVILNDTTIDLLSSCGGYAAYQHVWYAEDAGHNLSSSIAYGLVKGDAATPADNRLLQQAWCNLLWNATENAGFGVEYQFGEREVGSGNHGNDNRFMFVCQFAPAATTTKGTAKDSARRAAAQSFAAEPASGGGATLSQRRF